MTIKTRIVQPSLVKAKRALLPQSATESAIQWLPISLILTLATALFSYKLGSEGLWLDELNSVQDATQNSALSYLEHPVRPLYYLVLIGWMQFGNSDVWLRIPSVAFALISVFLLYRIGRRAIGEAEGLIAALLLAISPVVVNHAQEIRMYTLSLGLGLAGTLFLVNALLVERTQRPKQTTIAGWALFRVLAMYTVPLNILLLLPDVLAIALRFRQQKAVLLKFGKWLLILFALWSPAVLSVAAASSPSSTYASDHSGDSPPDAASVVRLFKFLTVWPFSAQDNAIAARFYKVFTLLMAGLAGAGIFQKHKSPNLLWVCAWCFLPVIPIVAFSYWVTPVWRTRYLLFISPYLFLLLAAGLMRLWRQWRISAIAIATIYFIAVSGGLFHHYTAQHRSDYKFNVATLMQHEQPGDGLIWSYKCCESGLRRYYTGRMNVYMNSVEAVKSEADVSQWLSAFPGEYERLWLVLDRLTPHKAVLEEAIAQNYSVEISFDYEQGSKVMLLRPLAK